MKKVFYIATITIAFIICVYFLFRDEINLWYITKHYAHSKELRNKLKGELIPDSWYEKTYIKETSDNYTIFWQIDLDTLFKYDKPSFYSKSITLSKGLFTRKLQSEEDVYINWHLDKLKYLKLIRLCFPIDPENIYLYDFELENNNFVGGFDDLRESEKTTLNFHFGDMVIDKSTFDSILLSWELPLPDSSIN